jgi:hypothetical protein
MFSLLWSVSAGTWSRRFFHNCINGRWSSTLTLSAAVQIAVRRVGGIPILPHGSGLDSLSSPCIFALTFLLGVPLRAGGSLGKKEEEDAAARTGVFSSSLRERERERERRVFTLYGQESESTSGACESVPLAPEPKRIQPCPPSSPEKEATERIHDRHDASSPFFYSISFVSSIGRYGLVNGPTACTPSTICDEPEPTVTSAKLTGST